MAQGEETIDRGWRVAGTGDVQVYGDLIRERRWEAATRERGDDEKQY